VGTSTGPANSGAQQGTWDDEDAAGDKDNGDNNNGEHDMGVGVVYWDILWEDVHAAIGRWTAWSGGMTTHPEWGSDIISETKVEGAEASLPGNYGRVWHPERTGYWPNAMWKIVDHTVLLAEMKFNLGEGPYLVMNQCKWWAMAKYNPNLECSRLLFSLQRWCWRWHQMCTHDWMC
jgi:hypothetical protein